MHWAAWGGSAATAKLLLERGAAATAADKDGRTPLHWTAYQLPFDDVGYKTLLRLIQASADAHRDTVNVLAAKGGLEARDHSGKTPLHLAAEEGFTAAAEALLANKADINAKDKEGKMPLNIALEKNDDDTAALLRKHGAKK